MPTVFGWQLQDLINQGRLFILDASPDPEGQEVVGNFGFIGTD